MRNILIAVIGALLAGSSTPAAAQQQSEDQKSHWGISFGADPSWRVPSSGALRKLVSDARTVDVSGKDIKVGIVRGRDLGGYWGVFLFSRSIGNGSMTDDVQQACFGQPVTCYPAGFRYVAKDVSMLGVLFEKNVPFVTIKRRVQVGITLDGGAASVKGSAESHSFQIANTPTGPSPIEVVSQVPGAQFFSGGLTTQPVGGVEVTGAAILAPGLKVLAGWGLNYPAYAASIRVVYLVGAK